MKGDLCKFDHGNDAVVLEDAAGSGAVPAYQPVPLPSSYTGKLLINLLELHEKVK